MTLDLSFRSLARVTLGAALASATACGPEAADPVDNTGTTAGTDTGAVTDTPTDGATGAPAACDAAPTPTLVHDTSDCEGLGFEGADLSIGGVPVAANPPGPDGEFADQLVGWRPANHGLTLEFALDSRSFATGLILRASTGALQGVRGQLFRVVDGEPQLETEASVDAAGDLVIPLTDIGHGVPYVLTLGGWPPDSCDELSVDIRC